MKYVVKLGIWQAYLKDAQYWHEQGDETRCYRALLAGAEILWTPEPSYKQEQQRKLFPQRGHLERTRANLRTIIRNSAYRNFDPEVIYAAIKEIDNLISKNIEAMRNL